MVGQLVVVLHRLPYPSKLVENYNWLKREMNPKVFHRFNLEKKSMKQLENYTLVGRKLGTGGD